MICRQWQFHVSKRYRVYTNSQKLIHKRVQINYINIWKSICTYHYLSSCFHEKKDIQTMGIVPFHVQKTFCKQHLCACRLYSPEFRNDFTDLSFIQQFCFPPTHLLSRVTFQIFLKKQEKQILLYRNPIIEDLYNTPHTPSAVWHQTKHM